MNPTKQTKQDERGTVPVRAWLVCEGDIGATGLMVAAVYREVIRARVRIVWSNGRILTTHAESLVRLACRPLDQLTGPKPGGRAAARRWLARLLNHP